MTDRQTYKIALPLRSKDDPEPRVSDPLRAAEKAMGMVPNMYAGMVNLPALLDTYSVGYTKFRQESGFTPAEQEIVFLAVSRANSCHYCMAAHSVVADMKSGVPVEVTNAIRDDLPIADRKLQALRAFVQTMVESRGNPTQEDAEAFIAAGYSEKHILAVILAISVKVISNYSNHLFRTELDPAFAARRWVPAA